MLAAETSPSHVREEALPSGLRFVLPSHWGLARAAFLGVWILACLAVELAFLAIILIRLLGALGFGGATITALSLRMSGEATLFFLVLFIGWTFGSWMSIRALLLSFAGKMVLEVIEVDGGKLKLTVKLGGYTRSRTFEAAYVSRFRVDPAVDNATRKFGMSLAMLAFDYGGETLRFGIGLTDEEARQIVKRVGEQFPGLVEGSK